MDNTFLLQLRKTSRFSRSSSNSARQDWAWSQRHGHMEEGAVVVLFRNKRGVVELTPCDLVEGREELVK